MPHPPRPTNFDWQFATLQHRDCLPHLRQENVLYFITFRLADSLPKARLQQLRHARDLWSAANPPPHNHLQESEYRRIWTAPIERLLDSGHGAWVLQYPQCRRPLEETLRHDDGDGYRLGDFIMMPNHVHVLVHVPSPDDLSEIMKAWKSISARRANRFLKRRGALWQAESFDHIVRDESHWARFVRYIRRNPAGLAEGSFTLGIGSLELKTVATAS